MMPGYSSRIFRGMSQVLDLPHPRVNPQLRSFLRFDPAAGTLVDRAPERWTHAEVTVPSLDDWEKQWQKNPQGMEKPKVVAVDFQAQPSAPQTNQAQAPESAQAQAV